MIQLKILCHAPKATFHKVVQLHAKYVTLVSMDLQMELGVNHVPQDITVPIQGMIENGCECTTNENDDFLKKHCQFFFTVTCL